MTKLFSLIQNIRACRICINELPFPPRPILQAHTKSRLLIVGQAPGIRVHKTGIPWNDPSGNRLRHWANIEKKIFYDINRVAIIPIGFCYPGKGPAGDAPPRKECSQQWLSDLLKALPHIQLTLLIGQYAQRHYLGKSMKRCLTETVASYTEYLPSYFPLPHPSPRNNLWLKKNPWFEESTVPKLRETCAKILKI